MPSSADTPPSTPAPSKKRPVEEGLCPEDSPHRKKSRQSEPELFTSIRKQRQLFCDYHDDNSTNNSSASTANGAHDHGDDSSDSDDDEVIITGTSSTRRTSTTNTNTCTTNATNRAFKTSKYDLSDDSDDEDVTFQGSTNNNLSASSAGSTTGTNITENYIHTVNIGSPRSNNDDNDDDDDGDVNDWCLDTTGYTNSQAIPIDDDDDDDIDMEQKDDNDLFIPSVMDTPAPSTTYTGNRASQVSLVTPDISPTKPSSTSLTSSTSFSSSASNRGGRARQFSSSKFTSTTGVTLASSSSSSSSSKLAPPTSSSNIHQLQAQAKPVAAVASATTVVPVDRDIGYYIANHPITTFTVATNDDGKAYDATLNYCNITNHRNNNKYYKMQIVKKIGQEEYYVWFKWGRVGDSATGQQLKGPFASKQDASSAFSKKFRAKSGNTFGALHFTPKADKYKLLDMQYDNLENVGRGSEGGHNGHAVSSFINVNRSHPLGNLSKQQVQDGIAILDRIADKLNAMANYNDSESDDMNDVDNMNDDSQSDVQSILDSSDTSAAANMTRRTTANSRAAAASTASASTATTSMTTTTKSAAAMPAPTTSATAMNPVLESFNELTSQFYTQIPHAFGRSIRPTVIDNQHVLQERYEALFAYVV